MIAWFAVNIGTIVLTIVIAVIVALIIRGIIKDKKRGKSSCGCNCANCPNSGGCHGH